MAGGRPAKVELYRYENVDRALCAGETWGPVKLVGDLRGRLVGA